MSVESKLGRRLIDLRDLTKTAVTNQLIEANSNYDLSLSEKQLRDISQSIGSRIEKTFDLSFDNVMSVLKEK